MKVKVGDIVRVDPEAKGCCTSFKISDARLMKSRAIVQEVGTLIGVVFPFRFAEGHILRGRCPPGQGQWICVKHVHKVTNPVRDFVTTLYKQRHKRHAGTQLQVDSKRPLIKKRKK